MTFPSFAGIYKVVVMHVTALGAFYTDVELDTVLGALVL